MDLEPFRFPMKLLRAVGLWQDKNSSFLYKLYGLLLHLYFVEQGIILSSTIVIIFLQQGKMIDFTQSLSTSLSIYVTMIKSIYFVVNIDKIKVLKRKLIKLLEYSNFKSSNRPVIEKYEKLITKLTKYNCNFHVTICTLSVIMAVMSSDRRLPFKTWSYFDYENDEASYMFMNCGIYLMSLYVTGINGMLDFYPAIFMSYIIGMIDELNEYFEDVKFKETVKNKSLISYSKMTEKFSIFNKDLQTDEQKLKIKSNTVDLNTCINYHVEIKKFCEDVSRHYSLQFMAQGFFSSLILCSTIFHLTKITFDEDPGLFMTTLMYATIMMIQILLPCYFGNKILTKSQDISVSLFHSDWIYGDRVYAKNVKLIMENLKVPMRIKIYGYLSVDYEIFKSVCNLAYSMYAVLNKKQS